MTIKIHSKNIKDRLKDNILDLSLCELDEVPVREIASVKKATHLDLSNNLLTSLPTNFVSINRIIKLDLSKNMLTELPENFGELKQLRHLDLYANQISRLPLSLSELRNLRWLDLKENPLTSAVASVAGPCSNMSECQACARNIVSYLSTVKLTIEEEKLRRLNTATDTDKKVISMKKEKKKRKEKYIEKENYSKMDTNGSSNEEKYRCANENDSTTMQSAINDNLKNKSYAAGGFLYPVFIKIMLWVVIFTLKLVLLTTVLSLYDKNLSEMFISNAEKRTGVSLRIYRIYLENTSYILGQTATALNTYTYNILNYFYDKYIREDCNNEKNDL